eukprot:m.84236 g.84236  ORF g.84236 m.84236 type:complete len:168 (+) comp14382_c2_seq1:2985-3488(+)
MLSASFFFLFSVAHDSQGIVFTHQDDPNVLLHFSGVSTRATCLQWLCSSAFIGVKLDFPFGIQLSRAAKAAIEGKKFQYHARQVVVRTKRSDHLTLAHNFQREQKEKLETFLKSCVTTPFPVDIDAAIGLFERQTVEDGGDHQPHTVMRCLKVWKLGSTPRQPEEEM